MKKILFYLAIAFLSIQIVNGQALPVVAPAQGESIMIKGATIHTGNGEVIENGIISFSNGKITAVGKDGETAITREAHRVIDATGKHVYPGLIMTMSNLGLSEIGSIDVTQDSREHGTINPGVRTLVAYNTDSHAIPVVRSNGVLLAQVVPSGGLLSGTSSVMQLDAWNWEDAAYKTDNGVHLNWPRMSARAGRRSMYEMYMGEGATGGFESSFKELDKLFTDAAAYAELDKPERVNLRLEAIEGLFTGDQILFISPSDVQGILASVKFAQEKGVKKLVLVNAGEDAFMVKDFIRENKIPVILSTVQAMPAHEHSDTRLPFKLAKMFMDEGITVGITFPSSDSGFNLPFAAGQAVAYGLTKEEALQMVSLNNAIILGIDDVTGSLEKGKDANILVSSGDLLDMMTNDVVHAFIQGRDIDLDNKHKMLYRRFQEKYKNGER
jgi:imidazolonepropionase-like amidohydrolase